jgi:hypothetical protein
MASDLESGLLAALLDFARQRLDALLNSLATDAEHLLLTVLPGATAAQQAAAAGTDAATHLAAANTHLTQLAADIGAAPSTLAQCEAAFAQAAGALSEIDAAVRSIATVVPEVGDAEAAILKGIKAAVSQGGDTVTGLLDQLGLDGPISTGITNSGTVLSYPLANAAERSLDPVSGAVLKLSNTTAKATLDYGPATPVFGISVTTGIAIGMSTDGFVNQVLGANASATATLTVSVDTKNGLRFQAGAKARADLDGQLTLPGVDLRGLGIEIPDGVPFGLALTGTIGGSLGPIAAVIQGAGVALVIDPSKIGNGDPITVALQPPSGAGLTVDAGVIHGGGFIEHTGSEYGGALDLDLGPIEIKAIGLVGTDPFSLVLVLSVEFIPPIQLSFGFTLNTVGGILALERTISADALRAGIHDHTADTVLFPPDPVAAAPTILQLLRQIFPAQQGAFVVGPMLELGWGAPVSFVTARLGVVIALPDPKVILIGSLRVALPLPQAPIVDIRADIYGEITPDHLLFMVSLGGSRLAGFSLAGDFGLLIAWGDHPDLAISAGGFHPHYSPPGELAGMRRVSVDISPPALITMRAEAYLALTSNSFQLGTRVELKAEVAGIGAEGHLQFDALVLWEPTFHFEIDLSAGVSLYAFGESFASVDLSLHLEGPGPWIASGHASLSLLFFDVDFDLPRITWGDGDNPVAQPVDPQEMVQKALSDKAAWEARLPPDTDTLARLVPLPEGGPPVVHPLGALEARQHVVPLETVLTHIESNPVEVGRVNLGAPTLKADGQPEAQAKAVSHASDLFSPGNFLDLTEDQKLSRPAFEPFPSGVVIAAETAQYGTQQSTQYEWFTVCPPVKTRTRHSFISLVGLHDVLLANGPAGLAHLNSGNPYGVLPEPIRLADAGAAKVRSTVDLGLVDGLSDTYMTTAAAAHIVDGLAAGTTQIVGVGVGK